MDAEIKKSCPGCCQYYSIQLSGSQQRKCRVPLLLKCGHSMCELCLRNSFNFSEPIECKCCDHKEELSQSEQLLCKTNIYSVFPVNIHIVGELAYNMIITAPSKNTDEKSNCFVDVKEILNSIDNVQVQCVGCEQPTNKMCKICNSAMCENCFFNSHRSNVFKCHKLLAIDMEIEPSTCSIHKGKALEYYCKDCVKSICMDCMIVGGDKSCKNHNILSILEINEDVVGKLNDISPKVDETFKRLTKTALDIGYKLQSINNETASVAFSNITQQVQNHFIKLHAKIQFQEQLINEKLEKLQSMERKSLLGARDNITEGIKKAKKHMNKLSLVMKDEARNNKINLSALLDEAEEIINMPWYLKLPDNEGNKLTLDVKEELFDLIDKFISLNGDVDASYKLISTNQIVGEVPDAPIDIVYAPEMARDARESLKPKVEISKNTNNTNNIFSVPKYRRNKTGSNSSLNSFVSESSQNNFPPVKDNCNQPLHSGLPSHTPEVSQFEEGTQHFIYISHIVNPSNFYVQRATSQGLVKNMLREFKDADKYPRPSANNLKDGKLFLAKIGSEKDWYRCRLNKVDNTKNTPMCHVMSIDFGNSETVPIDKLRLLPINWQSIPPLVVNCTLSNCEPKAVKWTVDDALLIQKIVDNKQAVINIRRIIKNNHGIERLECDLITAEDGVNLAQALVFHERANFRHRNYRYPKIMGLVDRPKLFFGKSDFRLNSEQTVILTHVISPDKFYVMKAHYQEDFDAMWESLNEEYFLTDSTGSVYCPEPGMVCVVNVDKYGNQVSGGGWRRAVVEALLGNQRVQVFLPDSGEIATIHWTALRRIRDQFTKTKALATECHLSGVTPLNKRWNKGSVLLMQSMIKRLLEAHVEENKGRGSLGVTLYDKSNADNIMCINSLMVSSRFAVATGIFSFNSHDFDYHSYPKSNGIGNENEKFYKILQKESETETENEISCKEDTQDDVEIEAKNKGPIKLEVNILRCESPALLYVSLVDQQSTFNDLYEKIQTYYTTKETEGKDNWAVGDKCCAFYATSKTWRRAIILSLDDTEAKLHYTDFAVFDTVPIKELKQLPPLFKSIGDAAIKCHLSGILSAMGEQWPSTTTSYLNELIDAYRRFFISKKGDIKDKSLPIYLWVYHINRGDALEPDTAEWRCLNRKIVEQGLALPDKSLKSESSDNLDNSMDGDDNMSYFIVDSLECLDKLCEPVPKIQPKEEVYQSTKNWLPSEPLPANDFTGVVTYIDDNAILFIHDVMQQDMLAVIQNALEVRFEGKSKSKFNQWVVGQPCIAMFYLDKQYYRGTVSKVDKDGEKCIIHYVDYGNDEWCAFKDMHMSVLHEIPVQAHKCRLNRIQPLSGLWKRSHLDYIHKLVVEKHCYIKVAGPEVDGVTPIELKFDKLWLNDHLVDFELAKFVTEQKVIEPSTESERNSINTSYESTNSEVDWYAMIKAEEEQKEEFTESDLTYNIDIPETFKCNVAHIHDNAELEIVVQNDSSEYNKMFEDMAQNQNNMYLKKIQKNQPCLAKYSKKWHRASILSKMDSNNMVTVKYVDIGKIDNISVNNIREISNDWIKLAPLAVTVKLNGVQVNPKVRNDLSLFFEDLEKTFLNNGPFNGKVIDSKTIPSIELKNDDGDLVYENLFTSRIFVKS